MRINYISDIQQAISRKENELEKLKDQLNYLPELKLSSVYKDGLVYGVCYKDGHGNLEAIDLMANQPSYLSEWAEENAKSYLDGTVYIVGFKPVSILMEVKV